MRPGPHRSSRRGAGPAGAALLACCLGPVALAGQTPGDAPDATRRVSVTWTATPIRDVLHAFALYSGKSIVAGADVTGTVTADIRDQPWDVVLAAILELHGLVATEDDAGIIRVEDMGGRSRRDAVEPLVTRTYRISYSRAAELQAAISGVLSERGTVSAVESANTLVVTDVRRVHRTLAGLIR